MSKKHSQKKKATGIAEEKIFFFFATEFNEGPEIKSAFFFFTKTNLWRNSQKDIKQAIAKNAGIQIKGFV